MLHINRFTSETKGKIILEGSGTAAAGNVGIMPLTAGDRLGRYEVISSAGVGWARCIVHVTPDSAATSR